MMTMDLMRPLMADRIRLMPGVAILPFTRSNPFQTLVSLTPDILKMGLPEK